MRALAALLLLAALPACSGEERQESGSPPALSARPAALPTAAQIDNACAAAGQAAIREMEREGVFVEPTDFAYVSRSPRCRWELGDAAVARCDFEQAEIAIPMPSDEQVVAARARLGEGDWKPFTARLSRQGGGWTVEGLCTPSHLLGSPDARS